MRVAVELIYLKNRLKIVYLCLRVLDFLYLFLRKIIKRLLRSV